MLLMIIKLNIRECTDLKVSYCGNVFILIQVKKKMIKIYLSKILRKIYLNISLTLVLANRNQSYINLNNNEKSHIPQPSIYTNY